MSLSPPSEEPQNASDQHEADAGSEAQEGQRRSNAPNVRKEEAPPLLGEPARLEGSRPEVPPAAASRAAVPAESDVASAPVPAPMPPSAGLPERERPQEPTINATPWTTPLLGRPHFTVTPVDDRAGTGACTRSETLRPLAWPRR